MAYLLNGSVVMIPYLCNRSKSISTSSLKLSGAGKFWLYAALSSMGVGLNFKSLLMLMSKRCLAKMSLNGTSRSSLDAFAC